MEFQLFGATVQSYGMGVNSEGRGLVESVEITNLTNAARKGKAFLLTSDFISLTPGSPLIHNGIIFLKNTSDTEIMKIDRIRTCGTQTNRWRMIKNPSTGTLISSGSSISFNNTNFTSGIVAPATAKVGSNGSTVTDGTLIGQWINGTGHSLEEYRGGIQLGTNDCIALTCYVEAAASVCANLLMFFDTDNGV